jgi:hypothetical protein
MAFVWERQRFPVDASSGTNEKEEQFTLLCKLKITALFILNKGCKV